MATEVATYHCPRCGAPVKNTDRGAFIEIGEYSFNRDSYDEEFDAGEYECANAECGTTFYL